MMQRLESPPGVECPSRSKGAAQERHQLVFAVAPTVDGQRWCGISHRRPVRGCHRTCLHHRHKAIAITTAGLDESLRAPGIPDGLARDFDAALECRVADELSGPH